MEHRGDWGLLNIGSTEKWGTSLGWEVQIGEQGCYRQGKEYKEGIEGFYILDDGQPTRDSGLLCLVLEIETIEKSRAFYRFDSESKWGRSGSESWREITV